MTTYWLLDQLWWKDNNQDNLLKNSISFPLFWKEERETQKQIMSNSKNLKRKLLD